VSWFRGRPKALAQSPRKAVGPGGTEPRWVENPKESLGPPNKPERCCFCSVKRREFLFVVFDLLTAVCWVTDMVVILVCFRFNVCQGGGRDFFFLWLLLFAGVLLACGQRCNVWGREWYYVILIFKWWSGVQGWGGEAFLYRRVRCLFVGLLCFVLCFGFTIIFVVWFFGCGWVGCFACVVFSPHQKTPSTGRLDPPNPPERRQTSINGVLCRANRKHLESFKSVFLERGKNSAPSCPQVHAEASTRKSGGRRETRKRTEPP